MPPATIRNATNILMELRKICQHPYLSAQEMENEFLPDEQQRKELVQSSGKLAFLKILLPKLKAKGHRVLLFSQFKIALDRLQDFLFFEGYSFLRLDGDAPQAQRQKDMDAFNAPDSEIFIFLLTTRAGGVGINLATADTVIVYDPDFNPHQDLQAIARSHRYGQNKKVLVFKLMTKDSVEGQPQFVHVLDTADRAEQIIQNGKRKMVLDHLVVQNLGKDGGDEGEVDTMLLHGTRALYDTNEDGTSATDVIYSSKQVDEMIEKVEKQADDEAKILQEKWDKEDAMTEEEKREAMLTRSSETMDFSFAKIWERERGDLAEVEDEIEEVDEDRAEADLEAELRLVQEQAQKSREKRAAEDLERNRQDRRKKVVYTLEQDTTPTKKKVGRPPKNKGKEKQSDAAVQSSDSEFQVDFRDASGEDEDETELDEIPENIRELLIKDGQAAHFTGLGKKKKGELTKLERKAMMKRFAEITARSNGVNGLVGAIVEGPHTEAGEPPTLHLDLAAVPPKPPSPSKKSKHPGETPGQRAARKAAKQERRQRLQQVLASQGYLPETAEMQGLPIREPPIPSPSNLSTHALGPVSGSSTPAAGPSNYARVASPPRISPLVDAARQTVTNRDIAAGQATINQLWHELQRFDRQDLKPHWANMAVPDRPFADRMGLYWGLASAIDAMRATVGEEARFTTPAIRPQLEVLFHQSAPGIAGAPQRSTSTPGAVNGARGNAQVVNGTNGHRTAAVAGDANRPPAQQHPTHPMPGPPTNVTCPELRPSPPRKRAVHLKSSIRPANIATPVAAPPRPATLLPPRPQVAAAARPPAPISTAPVPANSSQISPPINAVWLTGPASASTGPPSATLQTQRSSSGSAPPSATLNRQPHWATAPRPPPQPNGHHAQAYQAGPSRPSPTTPNVIHPPPLPPPVHMNGHYQNGIYPQCQFCSRSTHFTRECPNRQTIPKLRQFAGHMVHALSDPNISLEYRQQTENNLREAERRLKIHDRLLLEDAQHGVPPPSQHQQQPHYPVNGYPTPNAQPWAPSAQRLIAPVVNGPEGRSKDTAIAIDDEDDIDMAGPSTQQVVPSQPSGGIVANGDAAGTSAAIALPLDTQSNGHAAETSSDKPATCRLCKRQSSHELHQCPMIVRQPEMMREALARYPNGSAMKTRILDAIDRHIAENACPVCQKLDCNLGVKLCAEKHGGRKGLKDLIRRLDEEREEAGLEATPALRKLYDCYKAWPREDEGSARKKVKREQP